MFKSIRVRLILLCLTLTILPQVIVSGLSAREAIGSLQDQSIDLQDQLARQASISLESFFSERENELATLTQVYGLETLEPEAQRDVLLSLLADQPAYYELTLLEADGQEDIRLTRGEIVTTSDLANRSDDPLFQRTVETNSISFSEVHFNEEARDRLVTIAVPVVDLFSGQVAHVLIAEVRFQTVEESILRDLDLEEGEDVYVVDSSGLVIAHRNPTYVLRQTTFDLPDTEGRHEGLSGSDVILAMDNIQLENQNLTVVAETDYSKALGLATDLTQLSVIITALGLLISAIIVTLAVGRMINPIVKMARVAQDIQGGNLNARAQETGGSEIATLGRSFNGMTEQLSNSLKGLQQNVEQLEKAKVEREALIKDLQTAKRLADENSRLKSEFLSTMSHELRTPMNAIEGFTSIMLKRMAGVEFNEKSERYLNKVQSNSQRLLHLINDFLDLSRIESGRLELASMPISPANMVERWKNELSVLAEGKGIGFEVSLDPDIPATIYGDEEALSKITTNLLGNAFKFTSEGKVSLSLERLNGSIAIKVQDTGIGIPPHAREFIFDEFRQVDQSSKRKYGGTGLGLAIVQKLAREMNGTVALESELGKGSTFTVTIPLQTEKVLA